jgi:hypothetical protein
MDNRFQFQPWYVKLWRLRYYLLIPYEALINYMRGSGSFRMAWSIAIGEAQIEMEWWWTSEEVMERLKRI